jgi:hypothetical protein
MQSVMAPNSCEPNDIENITGDFPNWGTDNRAIATVKPAAQVNGISVGSTTHFTAGEAYAGDGHAIDHQCPMDELEPSAGTSVAPVITSFDPNPIMIGTSPPDGKLTINGSGFGTSPTVSLPAGVTSTGKGSTDTQIILTGVSVALSATVGNNNVTVAASGQTSAPASLTVAGPYQMVVQSDILGHCAGCTTTVQRNITYQINNFSGSPAQNVWIGEVVNTSGWSCTQSNPGLTTTLCSQNDVKSDGIFTDSWYLSSDSFTPVGCGFNVNSDHWQWCAHSSAQTLGTLQGYVHTNAVSENGVVNPPNTFPVGTVVPF